MSGSPVFSIAHALDAYLADAAARPFDWRLHNCCHFAAGWVRAATGVDPMQGLPATRCRTAAWRLIRRLGGDLAGALTSRLGRQPIQPMLARTGDIVLVPLTPDGSQAVGICNSRHAALLTARDGVLMLPMARSRLAWRLHDEGAPR